jgi:hypothetical protein
VVLQVLQDLMVPVVQVVLQEVMVHQVHQDQVV